jgi:3-isopropylmalate dehydrogenase
LLDIAFGLQEEAKTVTTAVADTLKAGWRTGDIANAETPADKILGTNEMGAKVLEFIK